jgi:hypothetical protein
MRFYRPTIKEPISTYVEAPLEYMQAFLNQKQAETDATRAAVLKEHESYLGVKPGQYTQDYYNEFKQKYGEQFNKLTQDIMSDASKTPLVAQELAKLNSQYKSDPLYAAITQDYTLTQDVNKKLVGTDKAYDFRRTNQLSRNPDGTYQMPTVEDYATMTDNDLFTKHNQIIAGFKPEVTTENGVTSYKLPNADGTYTVFNQNEKDKVTQVTADRIQNYINNSFQTINSSGEMDYYFRQRAKQEGNASLENNNQKRYQWWREYLAPAVGNAYKQHERDLDISETIQGVSNRTSTSSNGAGSSPKASEEEIQMKDVTSQARQMNYTLPGSDQPIKYMTDFKKGYDYLKTTTGKVVLDVVDMFNEGYKKPDGSSWTASDLPSIKSKFSKDSQGRLIPNDTSNSELMQLAGNATFVNALESYDKLVKEEKNLKAFEADIKKAAGVDNYDSKKIELATDKAKAEIYNSAKTVTAGVAGASGQALSEKDALEKFNNLPISEQNSLIEKFKDKFENTIKGNLPTKERKVYDVLESYNNRMADVQLRVLPGNHDAVNTIVTTLVTSLNTQTAGSFRNTVTNEVADIPELIEKIPMKDGKYDFEKMNVGYFIDPNEGPKGVMQITGGGSYEFPITEASLQAAVVKMGPTESARLDFYKQAVTSLNSSYGQEGKVSLEGLDFNFREITNPLDKTGKQKVYEYIDESGIPRRVTSLQALYNDIGNVYNLARNNQNIKLQEDLAKIQSAVKAKQMSVQEAQAASLKLINDASKINTGSLGKQQPQTQDPLGVLGQ